MKSVAEGFYRKWHFPHCPGAVDGKHIRIIPPPTSGSYYFNYKSTYSVVFIGVTNANYELIYVDVGTNGRISYGGVIKKTQCNDKLTHGSLKTPGPEELNEIDTVLPYVFVDEDFSLRPDFMKPYKKNLTRNTITTGYLGLDV